MALDFSDLVPAAKPLSFDDLVPRDGPSFDDLVPAKMPKALTERGAPLPPVHGSAEVPEIAAEQGMPPSEQPVQPGAGAETPIMRGLRRIGAAAQEGYEGTPPILSSETQEKLDTSPYAMSRFVYGPAAKAAGAAMAVPNAGFRAIQQTVQEVGNAVGQPQLGRDIAAMPEAFMGNAHEAPVGAEIASDVANARREAATIRAARSTTPTLDRMAAEAAERPVPKVEAAMEGGPAAEAEVVSEPAPSPTPTVEEPPVVPQALPPDAEIPTIEVTAKRPEIAAENDTTSTIEPPPETAGNRREPPASVDSPEIPGAGASPFEAPPREPTRLIEFLRRPTTQFPGTPHETVIPGGIIDAGGDLKAILGGSKGRPGLVNNKAGRSLDAATEAAWEAGYFPGHSERPEINDLLDAIRDDHNGVPRYSMHDDDRVYAYEQAMGRNAEIDRLAAQHDIPTTGLTRDQFFDALAEKVSAQELADRHASDAAEYASIDREARETMGATDARSAYGQSQARTLEDLEREYREAGIASEAEQYGQAGEEPGSIGPSSNEGENPGGSDRGIAGTPGGAEAQGATDLLGRPVAEPRARTTEPTIRTDERQTAIPDTDASAVQAQAARDAQGRGALRSDVPQKRPDEGLFAPDTTNQGTLYSFPAMLFEPDTWRRAFGPLAPAAKGVREATARLTQSIADGVAPIQGGTKRAQAFAADFANALRGVQLRYGNIDKELERNFSPKERDAMGRALDAQSVFEQTVREIPVDHQAAAREEFDAGGTGLSGLTPKQRKAVDALDAISQDVWNRMRERGMVAPTAQGLPYYMPRQILMWTEAEGFQRPSGSGGAGRGIDQRGGNLTTAGPMSREHLTPEETEAAARAKLGANAQLLRDIRSLPSRLAFSERAIAGVDLMNNIDRVGKDTGVDLVVKGDIPGLLEPGDYFTMADHPSFRRWTGTGWQAVNVSKEFEGPLKAVLTQPSPTWYRAAMGIKSGVMSTIMFSPFIHLAVELGRSLPVMPMRVLTFQALRDGKVLRANLDYMGQATKDGLSPLNRVGWTDIASIADLSLPPAERGRAMRALMAIPNAWHQVHQALLWDQVFNLQVGIYDAMRNKYIEKGYAPEVAGTMAAHLANRYAGALPPEHLSRAANMAANLTAFSRSFTLGNMGVMKDMLNGAPSHIRARIEQMAGPEVAKSAQSDLRRKAMGAFVMDIGLFYMANGLLQAGLQVARQGLQTGDLPQAAQDTWNEWVDKAGSAVAGAASNPLSIFGVLPQHWNEPGKQDRVFAGTDSNGKGIYLRLPPGKVGEEFIGWFAKPGTMLTNKASPLVRPVLELIMGHDTLGRQLLPPNPSTIGDFIDTAGAIVKHIGENLGPTSFLQGVHEMYQQYGQGQKTQADPLVSALKVIGPLTGLAQVSQGFPGGPAAGEIHGATEKQKYAIQQAMPDIRKKLRNDDVAGAMQDMVALGMERGQIRSYIQQTASPGVRARQLQKFDRIATPEAKDRLQRMMAP